MGVQPRWITCGAVLIMIFNSLLWLKWKVKHNCTIVPTLTFITEGERVIRAIKFEVKSWFTPIKSDKGVKVHSFVEPVCDRSHDLVSARGGAAAGYNYGRDSSGVCSWRRFVAQRRWPARYAVKCRLTTCTRILRYRHDCLQPHARIDTSHDIAVSRISPNNQKLKSTKSNVLARMNASHLWFRNAVRLVNIPIVPILFVGVIY